MEYEKSIDHAIVSKELAGGILPKCGFSNHEIKEILHATDWFYYLMQV